MAKKKEVKDTTKADTAKGLAMAILVYGIIFGIAAAVIIISINFISGIIEKINNGEVETKSSVTVVIDNRLS